MPTNALNIAIVGCGNIAGPYAHTLKPYSHIHLLGATDVDPQRAEASVYREDGSLTIVGPDEMLVGEAVLPGFSCPLSEVLR